MSFARLSCLVLAATMTLGGCSQSPTGPSGVVPNVPIGEVPQNSAPVPPRTNAVIPDAIGLTRFVAFGDSITWGASSAWDARFLFAAALGGYPERLQAGLNLYYSPQVFTVINEGVPGEQVTGALARFEAMLINRRPQAVLLLEGVNDLTGGKNVAQTIAGIQLLLTAAEFRATPVLLATMYQTYAVTDPDGHFRSNAASVIQDFNAEIRKLPTGRPNVRLVDLYPVMNDRDYVGADGIHTTDAGFEVMASTFLAAIELAFPVTGNVQ